MRICFTAALAKWFAKPGDGPELATNFQQALANQLSNPAARDEKSDLGGSMRLGAQEARLVPGSLARILYGNESIFERHRHRYEFNNHYLEELTAAGLRFSGFSADGLVEFIELPSHPWFVASQFHPEFTSTPRDGHPLFAGFVRAAREYRASLQPGRAATA